MQYFSVIGFIIWLLFSMVFVVLTGMGMAAVDVKIRTRIVVFILIFVISGAMSIFLGVKSEDSKQAAALVEAEWVAKGCPVYKGQCGSSKAPYECELKGVVVGRNRVGDMFVNAYPICAK